ncbi:MAG: hypothetical protein ACYSUT_01065 [Planctomycetota bacterium]
MGTKRNNCLLILLAAFIAPGAGQGAGPWNNLFDGKTLKGWEQNYV